MRQSYRGSVWTGIVASAGVAIVLGLGVWLNTTTQAAEEKQENVFRSTQAPRTAVSSRDTSRGTNADPKIDEILRNQRKILSRLDEVMEELKIVKIRASVR